MQDECTVCGEVVELVSREHWHGFLDTDHLVCVACGAVSRVNVPDPFEANEDT